MYTYGKLYGLSNDEDKKIYTCCKDTQLYFFIHIIATADENRAQWTSGERMLKCGGQEGFAASNHNLGGRLHRGESNKSLLDPGVAEVYRSRSRIGDGASR